MASSNSRDIFGKVLGVVFILSSLTKLLSVPDAVANFEAWHLGSLRYAVGGIELLAGISMFVPMLKRYGSFAFFCVMCAAFIVHLTVNQYAMSAMPVVFGTVVFIYLRMQGVVKLFPAPADA